MIHVLQTVIIFLIENIYCNANPLKVINLDIQLCLKYYLSDMLKDATPSKPMFKLKTLYTLTIKEKQNIRYKCIWFGILKYKL